MRIVSSQDLLQQETKQDGVLTLMKKNTHKQQSWMLISLAIESVVIPVLSILLGYRVIETYDLPKISWLIPVFFALGTGLLLIGQIQKRL